MKPRPKAPYHHGPCFRIAADPLDLSLCGDCLAFLIRDAAGIRSAIRERWLMVNRRAAAQEARRRVELERQARADVERVLKLDEGNGRGL